MHKRHPLSPLCLLPIALICLLLDVEATPSDALFFPHETERSTPSQWNEAFTGERTPTYFDEVYNNYVVYAPEVYNRSVVQAGYGSGTQYNHDSSIAYFDSRWFVVWNANKVAAEGRPGQVNYVATAPTSGGPWTTPSIVFSNAETSSNPVPPTGTQWQPNLIVVKRNGSDELWALWSQDGTDSHRGAYLSVLRSAAGKWENRQLTFNGTTEPVINNLAFHIFPSQDPVQLPTGRVLAPVTLIADHSTAPVTRNAALLTDDLGLSWHLSATTMLPHLDDAQWEPDFIPVTDSAAPGAVLMLARNNHAMSNATVAPSTSRLVYAISTDNGSQWPPLQTVPVETLTSRCMGMRAGARAALVLNDFPITGRGLSDRVNLALWLRPRGSAFSTDDVFAMIPGPSLTGAEPVVAYPQLAPAPDGHTLVMVYSQGRELRSIRTLTFDMPPDTLPLILPRGNRAVLDARPTLAAHAGAATALVFNNYQYLDQKTARGQTTRATSPPSGSRTSLGRHFSLATWVHVQDGPVVAMIDSRSSVAKDTQGFVFGPALVNHSYLAPMVNLNGPHNILCPQPLPSGAWVFLAAQVVCEVNDALVTFLINNDTIADVLGTGLCAPHNFSVAGARVGGAGNPFASSLYNLTGGIRSLAVWPDAVSAASLRAYGNLFAASVGQHPLVNASAPPPSTDSAALWLDAADDVSLQRDFAWPAPSKDVLSWNESSQPGNGTITACGRASASVEVPRNRRSAGDGVFFNWTATVGSENSGVGAVLATVGDAVHAVRVLWEADVAPGARLSLVASNGTRVPCAAVHDAAAPLHLSLSSWGRMTQLTMDQPGRGQAQCAISTEVAPVATWLFLGDGYTTDAASGLGARCSTTNMSSIAVGVRRL